MIATTTKYINCIITVTIVIFKLEISLKNFNESWTSYDNHTLFFFLWFVINIFDTDKNWFSTNWFCTENGRIKLPVALKIFIINSSSYHKLKLTLSCWLQNPFLFRGIFMSILALTIVILEVTKKMWHRPKGKMCSGCNTAGIYCYFSKQKYQNYNVMHLTITTQETFKLYVNKSGSASLFDRSTFITQRLQLNIVLYPLP